MRRLIKNTTRRARRKLANLPLMRWAWSDRYLLLLAIDAERAPVADPVDGFDCNNLEHLRYFQQTERWLSPEAFIAEARARIGAGLRLYTAVGDGVLLHYGWLVPLQEHAQFPYVAQSYDFPAGTAVLFNAYTHPAARGSGLHERSMRRRVSDAARLTGIRHIYTAIESHNAPSRAVAARTGFRCAEVLYEISRFGAARRGRMTSEEYFRTVEPGAGSSL